jgi:plastocyanin
VVLTRRLLIGGLCLSMAVAVLSPPAHARASQGVGLIRGRVETSDRFTAAPRPSLADVATGPAMPREPANRRASVVYLEDAPRGAFTDLPAGRARLDQKHEQFVPHVLAITVGTIVDFPNNDLTFHNVFSLSPITHFDLGRYPAGRSKWVKFDHAGIVPVFCDIHSHMSAYILVFSHPFFALTDDDGKYTIPGIPPGTYSVAVWSEAGSVDPQKITIGDGSSLEVSFRVGRRR